jgi:polar amino acid transport system substrate-binding protein
MNLRKEGLNMRARNGFVLATLFFFLTCSFLSMAWGESTLDTVKKRGKLIVGVRYDAKPWGYIDEKGKNAGFDIEIAQEIAKRLGVDIEMVQVTGKSRIPMLQTGKVDLLAAGLTHTRSRDKAIDYSITYINEYQRFMVRKGSPIRSMKDLEGKTVSTIQGTTMEKRLAKRIPTAKILSFQENPQAFMALKQGKADAFTQGSMMLSAFAQKDPDVELVGEAIGTELVGLGVRENDSKWRDFINFTLQDMWKDGAFDKIYGKWFGKGSVYSIPFPFDMEVWR